MAERRMPVYKLLASIIQARLTCKARNNHEWFDRHTERIHLIARECLPSGCGINSGTTVDLDRSTGDRIVLHTAYHHMDDGGGYAGWTEHTITITASLVHVIDVRISGRNRNEIKDYLADTFRCVLENTAVETADSVRMLMQGE